MVVNDLAVKIVISPSPPSPLFQRARGKFKIPLPLGEGFRSQCVGRVSRLKATGVGEG